MVAVIVPVAGYSAIAIWTDFLYLIHLPYPYRCGYNCKSNTAITPSPYQLQGRAHNTESGRVTNTNSTFPRPQLRPFLFKLSNGINIEPRDRSTTRLPNSGSVLNGISMHRKLFQQARGDARAHLPLYMSERRPAASGENDKPVLQLCRRLTIRRLP